MEEPKTLEERLSSLFSLPLLAHLAPYLLTFLAPPFNSFATLLIFRFPWSSNALFANSFAAAKERQGGLNTGAPAGSSAIPPIFSEKVQGQEARGPLFFTSGTTQSQTASSEEPLEKKCPSA